MNDIAWNNGRVLMAHDAMVALTDRGHTLGLGVFETMRAVDGTVRHRDLHHDRFRRGAHWLGLGDVADFDSAIDDLLGAAPWSDVRLRIQATPGPGGLDEEPRPTVTGLATPTVLDPRPVVLRTASWRLDPDAPWVGLKTTQYAGHLSARREAQAAGADDALLLDRRGFVAEATTSNIALRIGDQIFCPGPEQGAVDGVTRKVLAPHLGGSDALPAQRLPEVDEAVLLSAVQGVRPVASIDGHALRTTDWTHGLQEAWA